LLSGVERDDSVKALQLFLFLLPFLLERSSASSSDIAFDRECRCPWAVKVGLKVSALVVA
jgi:hypothetical protein